MLSFLDGKKTHIAGILMILVGVAELVGIDFPGVEAANASKLVMEGFGLMFLRAGIAKVAGQ